MKRNSIDDPYEPPAHAELTLTTVGTTPEDNARRILDYLLAQGFVRGHTTAATNGARRKGA